MRRSLVLQIRKAFDIRRFLSRRISSGSITRNINKPAEQKPEEKNMSAIGTQTGTSQTPLQTNEDRQATATHESTHNSWEDQPNGGWGELLTEYGAKISPMPGAVASRPGLILCTKPPRVT